MLFKKIPNFKLPLYFHDKCVIRPRFDDFAESTFRDDLLL